MNDVEAEYKYLRPSIERFPTGPELVDLALAAGFKKRRLRTSTGRVNGVFSLPSLAVLYAIICCTCTTVVLLVGSSFIFFNLCCDWC